MRSVDLMFPFSDAPSSPDEIILDNDKSPPEKYSNLIMDIPKRR